MAAGKIFFAVAVVCLCVMEVRADGGGANDLNYILKGNDWPGLCATGKYQSPVDLKSSVMGPIKNLPAMVKLESLGVVSGLKVFITSGLPHLEITWDKFVVAPKATVPATKDTGDVFAPVNGDVDPKDLKQVAIEASQCHFHSPSESSIDGVIFEGVLHCVHFVKDGESKMCDDIKANGGLGCPVVVSMMLEAQGTASAFDRLVPKNDDEPINEKHIAPYSKVLTNSGKENGAEVEGTFNLDQFLPQSGRYVTLKGSLTTAPCTEGVLWVNMLQPLGITPEQLEHLRDAVAFAIGDDCKEIKDGQCFPARMPNNRERHPLNDRILMHGVAF